MAGVAQAHLRLGRRLCNPTPADNFCSIAHNRRSRLRSLSTHPEARNRRKDGISLRPWRPLHRYDAGDQGIHLYLGAKACGWVDHAWRMAPRRFQPSLLPDRHARHSEKGAEYRHFGSHMVVWGENGSLVISHKWSLVPTTPSREASLIEMPVALPWTASHAREPRCRAGTLRLLTEAGHGGLLLLLCMRGSDPLDRKSTR